MAQMEKPTTRKKRTVPKRTRAISGPEKDLYHTLFKEAMDGIFIADRQGNYIDVNARGCKMLGYTRREILRMNLRDLIPAEDLKATPLRLEDMLTGQTVSNERRLLCKNGKLLPVEIGGRRLSNGNLLGIVRDRSAREKAEMESRALAHFAVENPTPMLRVDADGKIVFANDASRPLLKSWKTRVGRSLPREWKTFIGERLGGGSRAQAEVVCGDRVFSILFVPAPKDGFVNLYGQDVTEEKQEARRYHFLLDQSHDAIFILDLQGGYIQANQRTAEMLGYSLEELQHLNVQDTSAEPEISRELLKRLLGGEHIPAYERLLRRKDGSVFPVEINMELARDANGQPLHVQSIVRDISERKTIEQELRASEAKYRTLIEQLPAVVYLDVLDGKGTSLFVSPKLEEILGVTAEEWLDSDNQIWLDLIHPDDRQRMSEAVGKLTVAGQEYDYEYRVIRPDGRMIWLRDKGAVLQGKSGELLLQGIMFDISQNKLADFELAESYSLLETTLEATADGILVVDRENKIARFNQKFVEMLQIPAEILATRDHEQTLAFALPQIPNPDDFLRRVRDVYEHPDSDSLDTLILKDGRVIERFSQPQFLNGKIMGRVWSFRDVTGRKKTEQALRASELLLRQAQAAAGLGSYEADLLTKTWKGSEVLDQIFGIDREFDHNLAGWLLIIHPDDQEAMRRSLWQAIDNGQPFDMEYRIIRRDNGSTRWVHGLGKVEFDEGGQPVKIHGTIQDVTERKRRELALEADAMLAQTLGESMELRPLLDRLLEAARHAIPAAEKGNIALLVDDEHLQVRAVVGYEDDGALGFTYPTSWGYAGRAMHQRRAALIPDVQSDPELRDILEHSEVAATREVQVLRSAVVVPLIVREKPVGILSLESTQPNNFNETDLDLLANFAASGALILDRARFFEESRRRAAETAVLLSTSLALDSLDLQATLRTIGERSRGLFAADGCRIFLIEPDGETLRCVLAVLEDPAAFSDLKLKIGEGVTGFVAASGEAEIVADMLNDPRSVQVPGTDLESETIMFAPLKERDQTIGVISIRRIGTQRPFQPSDLELLKALASMAASAVSNARLFEESRQRVAELEMIYKSGLALNQLLTPKEIGQKVIELLKEKMQWHNTTIRIYRPETGTLELLAFHLPGADTPSKRRDAEARFNRAISRPGDGLCGWAFQNVQIVRSSEISDDPRYTETYPGLHSGLYVPLQLGERAIGVIGIESAQPNAFGDADERLVATLANQAAIALENARLFVEAHQHALEQSIIHQASQSILGTHLDPQTVYQSVREAVFQIMPCEAFVIVLADEASGDYQAVYLYDSGQTFPPRTIPRGTGLSGKVISEGKSLFIHDNLQTGSSGVRFGTEQRIRSILAVPLREDRKIVGMVAAESYQPDAFNEQHRVLLETLAAQMAAVIQNARLFEETRKRVAELETVNRISIVLRAISDQTEMLAIVLEETLTALKMPTGAISLWNEGTGKLHRAAARGWLSEFSELPLQPGEGIFGNVFASGDIHVTRDFISDPLTLPENSSRLPPGWGGACIPIRSVDRILGVLLVAVPAEREVSRDEIRLLNTLAEMTGSALQRMNLYEETQRRAGEFESLYETMTAISGEHDLPDLLQTIVISATKLLGAGGGGMYLYDSAAGDLRLATSTHEAAPIGTRLNLGEGLAGRVAQNRQPMRMDDYSAWERGDGVFKDLKVHAILETPMLHSGELIGVLAVEEVGDSKRTFTDRDERLLSFFAAQAAGAVRSARLRKETERRLQNLQSLREVDRVIASSFDLRPILNTVISHTIAQLNVDAADVLILDPVLQLLEFAAGRGFRTREIESASLRLGDGQAGKAALERRVMHISDLSQIGDAFLRSSMLADENFLEYYGVPLVSKGEVKGVLEVFHRSPLPTDPEWQDLLETMAGQVAIAIDNAQLFESIQRSNLELGLAYDATIEGWSRAMDLRDQETEGHTQRVTSRAVELARAMGMMGDEIVHLRRGALLHDIGKIGIPDNILLKPGDLTEEEWAVMRKHPVFASEMLRPISYLRRSLDIPYLHHERWDGSGYPFGLAGEQIPLAARIFAVVDVYDALTSDRPYRKAWTKAEAQNYIRENSGKLFDPEVAEVFLEMCLNETD